MNVVGTSVEMKNILPLFGEGEIALDPIQELISESLLNLEEEQKLEAQKTISKRLLVSEHQFPDQSMYVLDQQLKHLKDSLERIKFYLGDLDDLLPR